MTRGGRKPKLKLRDVAHIRAARARGERVADLARFYVISESSLRRYLRGECRAHKEPA